MRLWPSSVCTARSGTPAITKRLANVAQIVPAEIANPGFFHGVLEPAPPIPAARSLVTGADIAHTVCAFAQLQQGRLLDGVDLDVPSLSVLAARNR